MTHKLSAYTVDPLLVVLCARCGNDITWLTSHRTQNRYAVDVKLQNARMETARNWFHQCVVPEPTKRQLDGAEIQKLFDVAKQHLKYPKIWLQTKSGQGVMIYRAGERSKYYGQIQITNGERFNRVWFGRIDQQGTFHKQSSVTDELMDLLTQLSLDPAGTAAQYGKLTGNCCFCYRKLQDQRSTDMGYGPVCADHFGLAWGNTTSKPLGPLHQQLVAALKPVI